MNHTFAEGAVILAPHGRDASIACSMLQEGGIQAASASSLTALVETLRAGAGFAIVTEEALRGADLRGLSDFVADQAEWSDLPFIVLTERGGGLERNPGAVRLLETLGNVTFLERPFHPTTLLSLARSARRARLRQYDARKRLKEIHEAQIRLRVALSAGGLGAWAMNVRSATLEADAVGKAQFGRDPEQPFTYEDLQQAIHPDDREAADRAARQALDTCGSYAIDYRSIWPDGSVHWLQITGRVEVDAKGRPTQVVGVSHEITERRRVEVRQQALLTLSDDLRETDDAAAMSYSAAKIIGRALGVSRAGYGIIDPIAETIAVERDWQMPGTETLAGVLRFRDFGSYIEDLKRGEAVAISDVRTDHRTADRASALEAIHARAFFALPIVEKSGLVALLSLNHEDVRDWPAEEISFVQEVADRTQTAIERRKAEQALAELAETLERKVEARTRERDRTWQNSQDLLAILTLDGTFLAVNPAWTDVLGWLPTEIVGQHHVLFSHPDDQEASDGAHQQALVAPVRQYENRVRHKDGSHRWISWVATTDGEQVYASGRHVTAEREARAELEEAQAQLRQAQKMEAVGQLTGGLAHDFNNLLTAITGSLELIQMRMKQGRSEDIDRYISMAQQGAQRAAALTHRLLAFSRRQTLDPRPTNINTLIAGLDDLLRRSVGPAIEIECVGAGGLWTTPIDPNQLENAILNLCINARDAMPDGGRITIETANKWLDATAAKEHDLVPGQYVSLCVTDTGTGMTPETVERAFDPFYTTKPMGQGTGLGLSMIYGFVRQSGGQVRIYSELGVGTTMCLYLPRSHAEAADAPAADTCVAPAQAPSGATVLVVDDEPAVRALITDILGERGYHAIEAGDGPAGLAILKTKTRVDLLITDVGLPKGMNGRQLADAARVGRPDLKILFITGYAENAVVGNGHLDHGMHVLTKPFAMDALARKIDELING